MSAKSRRGWLFQSTLKCSIPACEWNIRITWTSGSCTNAPRSRSSHRSLISWLPGNLEPADWAGEHTGTICGRTRSTKCRSLGSGNLCKKPRMRLTTTAGCWARPLTVISPMTASLMWSHVSQLSPTPVKWNFPICIIFSECTGSTWANSAMHSLISKWVRSLSWQPSHDISLSGVTSRSCLGSAAAGNICRNRHSVNHPACMGSSIQCP